ncbi:hypothetical protein ABVK25_006900 [Lepraria finkii]|uniref:Uncharacterized protein n=1 Tax=Lepraria finkii TaxID=1340010 RepID=A0ABR4B538_9LECA
MRYPLASRNIGRRASHSHENGMLQFRQYRSERCRISINLSCTLAWLRGILIRILHSEGVKVSFSLFWGLVLTVAALLYTFTRVFIVVKSLISLRHVPVPIGAYSGVTWAQLIPHL